MSSQILKKKVTAILLILCCSSCLLTGCGSSDAITEETLKIVNTKTDETLQLYGEIEKMVADNNLVADQSFIDMKSQLKEMADKIKADIHNTTEEDGKETIKELDRILENLKNVKANVEQTIQK